MMLSSVEKAGSDMPRHAGYLEETQKISNFQANKMYFGYKKPLHMIQTHGQYFWELTREIPT